ncbi:MAG: Ig-like domain-containing protein [Leucobacter sp.]
MTRWTRLLVALALTTFIAASGVTASSTPAAADQLGTPQVTLNPGGGILTDASDGVRFTINSDPEYFGVDGVDHLNYRGTTQYCCSAAAPMLNIGGQLFGQGGPAYGSSAASWTSLEILNVSGSTSTGPRTSATGDAAATVRYTTVKNGLTYTMDRAVSYTYPNDYVTENYTFVIPEGNTENVKFYQGGDTAPGGSDTGLGIMLTEPVRAAISVNPNSEIMLGYREVAGSKPFDGARAAWFYNPYATVISGGDIGFVVEPTFHDAGLMIQWTLGSTPGTFTAAMQSFSTQQGVNLTASSSATQTTIGAPFNIDFSVANTQPSEASGLGFDFTLPAGLTLSGDPTNTCGGTISTATAGVVSFSGGSAPAMSNCVLSVPVVAAAPGTYAFSGADVTSTSGLTNTVGAQSVLVGALPAWQSTTFDGFAVGIDAEEPFDVVSDSAVSYVLTAGDLPTGVSFSADGLLTGVPMQAGTYQLTITATNDFGSAEQSVTVIVKRGTTALVGSLAPTEIPFGDTALLEVSNAPSWATGTVTFRSGSTVLCTTDLDTPSCETQVSLAAGNYTNVQAEYSGDDNWLGATVNIGSLTVLAPAVAPEPVSPQVPSAEAPQVPGAKAPQLSVTGAGYTPWLAGSGILLLLGGSVLLVRRLRRA